MLLLLSVLALVLPAPAAAQMRLTPEQAAAIAARTLDAERVEVTPRPAERLWDVSDEHQLVVVDDRTGAVLETWTGPQVGWPMARGYPGAFGGAVNAPWIWGVLAVLFAAPFLRGPPRLVHLDVAVLLAFSLGYAAFNGPHLKLSATLSTLALAYLLARALQLARRGPPDHAPWTPPLTLLVFLLGFRALLALTGGNVIDVGYAGVIGADRLTHGEPLYGHFPADNAHGDTYGPVAYAAYVPFELAFPWSGTWDELPAARAAAVAFDLACVALCWLLGRRLNAGRLLAYLWAAYPFTLLAMASAANDALVAALILAALALAARPAARGAVLALAGLTKFAPLALAPLLATYRRGTLVTVAAAVGTAALILAPFELDRLWERTLGFQAGRSSPFSLWGSYGWAEPLQPVAVAATVILAVAVAFVPRRRDLHTLCALAAAVLIALQLALGYWFYLYLVWFVAPLWAALSAPSQRD